MKMKTRPSEPVGYTECSPKRKVYNHSAYIKETESSHANDLMWHLKVPEKQEQANLKSAGGEK
jgi:hypothetical protein